MLHGIILAVGSNELIILFILLLILVLVFRLFKKKKSIPEKLAGENHLKPDINKNHKKIFINYRKEDSSGYSLALYNELIKWYNKDTIFKDSHTIEPGEDFEVSINNALNSCGILLVIMSDKWMEILGERQKLKKQKDFVAIEISTAFQKDIYTIPITINKAPMPKEGVLPNALKLLAHRQFLDIDQTSFETDVLKLVEIIDKKLSIHRN